MTTEEATTKQCPFCAETIQAAAIVCRWCGHRLSERTPLDPAAPARMVPGKQPNTWRCSRCDRSVRPFAEGCAFCKQRFDVGAASAAPPAAAPTTKKGSSAAAILLVIVAVCTVIWFALPSVGGAGTGQTHRITYRVHGTADGASLTYENAQGGSEQKEVSLPWNLSFSARGGQFLYISAQNSGEYGTVTCDILLDDTIVKTSTSEGAYTIASCSGKL